MSRIVGRKDLGDMLQDMHAIVTLEVKIKGAEPVHDHASYRLKKTEALLLYKLYI
jgi:hypothetical protein